MDNLPSPIAAHYADTAPRQITPRSSPRPTHATYIHDVAFTMPDSQVQGSRSLPTRSSLYYSSPQANGEKGSGQQSSSGYSSSHLGAWLLPSRCASDDHQKSCPQIVSLKPERTGTPPDSHVPPPGNVLEWQAAPPSEGKVEHKEPVTAHGDQPTAPSTGEDQALRARNSPKTSVKSDPQSSVISDVTEGWRCQNATEERHRYSAPGTS